ncbi:hypothetical protein [Agrococcus sediminis]|uniref:hypothetical protein n=1 Tax=Agrococcus sediminis TaxID=2599924 RepID=UPI001788BA32|nr:hypothetical protein [Agrococcus sediminis]
MQVKACLDFASVNAHEDGAEDVAALLLERGVADDSATLVRAVLERAASAGGRG